MAGFCPDFGSHGAAVHISVTGIGFNFVMFLTVTAGTGFSVLHIALGDVVFRIGISGAGIAAGAVRTIV